MRQILEQQFQIPERPDDDIINSCMNFNGNIRLHKIRDTFVSLDQKIIPSVTYMFKAWRNDIEALILKRTSNKTGKIKYIGVKASKRGNDVCSSRQNKKIGYLKYIKKDVQFFTQEDAEKGIAKANVLWVTFTCNSNLGSLDDAWRSISKSARYVLNNLEKKYGKIKYFYTPEVYPDPTGEAFGYPHIHMILVFKEHNFSPFPHLVDKNGQLEFSYRIQERAEFKKVADWHSFVDIKAIKNANGLYSYCRKHVENTLQGETDQAYLNNAVMWFYRKKSYCCNHDFKNSWIDLITNLQVIGRKTVQIDFFGEVVPDYSWEFLGMGSAARLEMEDCWAKELDPGVVQDELMLRSPNNRGY